MSIRRTTVNLTPITERQVEALKDAGYGTFTAIVRTAIDRMYRDELQTIEDKLHEVALIEVEYSEDGLFGAEGSEGYDLRASFEKFEELLQEALRRDYSEAEVNIRNGGDWHQAKDTDGLEIEAESEAVGGIIYNVHSEFEWLVKQH